MSRVAAALAPVALALLVAAACGTLVVIVYGQDPVAVWRLLADGAFGSAYAVGQVLFKATPLVFTGLSVAVAFEAGLFNIGAEGQLAVGAFATALVGAALPPSTPRLLALAACLGAGLVAGGAAGAIPGVLKAWRGAHEVIVTIMLNFVILAKLSDFGQHFFLRESVHTAPIVTAAELPRASALFPSLHGSALNASALLALATAAATWWLLARTGVGFRLRSVGQNRDAAETAGISVGRQVVLAMTLAGAIAGLVGANFVLGYKRYYEEGFGGGAGFMGIAVALVGRNHPVGIVAASILFGALSQGGLAVNALVPKEMVDVLEAVVILAVAATAGLAARGSRR